MIRLKKTHLLIVILAVVLGTTAFAFAANIIVPVTRITNQARAITANTLKPADCAGITLNSVVICTGGNCDGDGLNNLILGTAAGERLRGRGGTDCILGGGGNDDLQGNGGSDVCIGGPGTDTFVSCSTQIQ